MSSVSCSACYFYIIVVYLLPLCLNRVINNSVMLLWHSNNIICYVPYSLPLTNVNKKCKFTIRTFLCYLICNQVLGNTLSNTNLLIENALISDLFLFLKGHRDRKRASIYLKSWQFIYVGKFLQQDRRRCDFLFKYI